MTRFSSPCVRLDRGFYVQLYMMSVYLDLTGCLEESIVVCRVCMLYDPRSYGMSLTKVNSQDFGSTKAVQHVAPWMRARGGIPSHGAFVFLFLKACLGFSPSLRACTRQEHPRVSMIGAALGPQRPGRQLSRRVRADTAAGSGGIATIFSVFLICHPSSRPAPYRRRRHGASYMHQGTRY